MRSQLKKVTVELDKDIGHFLQKHNTQERRETVMGIPPLLARVTFETYPERGDQQVLRTVREWSKNLDPLGLVLNGPPGTGKSGLAVCALKALAAEPLGSWALWNGLTGPYTPSRIRPAPVWFESWVKLRRRLTTVVSPRDEERMTVMDELHKCVQALALDDIDVDPWTGWKDVSLLPLLEWPEIGRPLIITMNVNPKTIEEKLGERCADRLLDASMFKIVHVKGASLRERSQLL